MYLTKFIATDARFENYLVDPSVRFSSYINDPEYIKNIGNVLTNFFETNKLLLRAKIVKRVEDSYEMNLVQVWETKKDREDFCKLTNDQVILNSFDFQCKFEYSEIDDINDMIDNILKEENYLIQFLNSKYHRKNIIIGDPLH
jgi:hypothetical protein